MITYGALVNGTFDATGDTDAYNFVAPEDQVVNIHIASTIINARWFLYSPSGTELRSQFGEGSVGPLPANGT